MITIQISHFIKWLHSVENLMYIYGVRAQVMNNYNLQQITLHLNYSNSVKLNGLDLQCFHLAI